VFPNLCFNGVVDQRQRDANLPQMAVYKIVKSGRGKNGPRTYSKENAFALCKLSEKK